MKLLCKLLGLLLLLSAVEASSITMIQLRNRPAVEVIPVVEPMLESGDAISGQGFKIFLRASPPTVAQVRAMIEALDIAAKTLQISVFQGSTRGLEQLGFGAGVRIEGDNASVEIGHAGNSNAGGGGITYSTRGGNASINSSSTRLRLQDEPIHQMRVTEGMEAYIETGAEIPYFSGAGWIRPKAARGGVDYKRVTTGFYVLPRVRGEQVTLRISPFKNTADGGGSIDTSSADTTVTGRIGEWILVGGVSEQLKRKQSGGGSTLSTQSRSNHSIWIRADLVR